MCLCTVCHGCMRAVMCISQRVCIWIAHAVSTKFREGIPNLHTGHPCHSSHPSPVWILSADVVRRGPHISSRSLLASVQMKSAAAVLVFLGLGLSPAAACGWLNERCCSGAVACKVDGLVCIDGRCKEGPCGGNGEVCCADEACDLHSLVCLGGSCTPCGKEGEPVCNGVPP